MNHFLAIQHTYKTIEVGLFKKNKLIQLEVETKKNASKNIVVLVKKILQDNNVFFDDLLFFAANQGPGPFTTLRVVIATINGLAFATKKPLIGVDGLNSIIKEYKNEKFAVTVALLNAYSDDVYFGIQKQNNENIETGYKNIDLFLKYLKTKNPINQIQFIGQAVDLYKEKILKEFKNKAFIPENIPTTCSIKQVGIQAYKQWINKQNLSNQLLPLYLKSMRIIKKKV